MLLALACLAAYLLGGIPFGLILARLSAGVDIRRVGSGNIGATNAARAFDSKAKRLVAFAVIYLLDFAKGFLPTLFLPPLIQGAASGVAVAVGCCSVLGHCFSPYLRLRGGKGVATGCGVFAAIEPWALLVALVAFGCAFALTRRVFVGSLTLGIALAIAVVVRDPATAFAARASVTWSALAVAGFFFFTHRSNLRQSLAKRASA